MSEATVLHEIDSNVATVWLNRPDRANTLNEQLLNELRETMLVLANHDDVRAIVLTSRGRHFCGGADLRAPRLGPKFTYFHSLDLDWVPQPIIAAINGAAMGGGCELALTCDFRFMSSTAQIGLTEIRFGALPAGGGTARLPRLVGPAAAKRLIMTGEPIDAAEAERIGLVDRVCEPDELVADARAFAETLAVHAPYAMRTAKRLINQAVELDLRSAMDLERRLIANMGTPEEIAAAREDAASRMSTYANIFSKRDAS